MDSKSRRPQGDTAFAAMMATELLVAVFTIIVAAILVRSGAIGMALLELFQ